MVPGPTGELSDVDHFLPFSLMSRGMPVNLDQVWNLVLACATCNRGQAGKMAAVPDERYLARLHRRNEYLISSHHPLRETLMIQTRRDPARRQAFLSAALGTAKELVGSRCGWTAPEKAAAVF